MWVRNKDAPVKRRIGIIYKTTEPNNQIIEQLLEVTPYGDVTKILLECIRIGAEKKLNGSKFTASHANEAKITIDESIKQSVKIIDEMLDL